jgi:hypothetical protein
MVKNVGNIDKIIRVIIALGAIYLGWKGGFSPTISYLFFGLAAMMLLVAFMGSCPLYSICGKRTNTSKEE